MTEFAPIAAFAPLSAAMLERLVGHADATFTHSPEDADRELRLAAHHATSISYAATALQQAVCSDPTENLTNDAWCGPVTTAAAERFVADYGDAYLAALIKSHWITRESGTAGILRRPAGWLAAIVTAA